MAEVERRNDRKVLTNRKTEVKQESTTRMVLKKTEETRHVSTTSIKLEKSSAKMNSHITNGVESGLSSPEDEEVEVPLCQKEVISTGVDLASLKSTFSKGPPLFRSESTEQVETGVSVKSLCFTFLNCRQSARPTAPPTLPSDFPPPTGGRLSVAQLKSAFQETSTDMNGSSKEAVEEVKPTVDPAKVVQKFNQQACGPEVNVPCKICGKHVYQMEKLKAEKAIFHKLCFRCKECKKLLTLDTYQSHEGSIYCRQHFRLLFQPKVRLEDEDDPAPRRQRRNEMIIRENTPQELPPDVVRCEAKPDYGLESLPSLHDVKSRFESGQSESPRPPSRSAAEIQRSDSIMQRLARYQSAVRGENGEASSESEDEEGESHVINKAQNDKEQIPFTGLSSLKSQWEQGTVKTQREEIVEIKKEEQKRLRQRMCLGRSESMRQVYEKACHEATTPTRSETTVMLDSLIQADKIKEKFEKGQVNGSDITHEKIEKMKSEMEEDLSVFTETGIAHNARSLFKQMDATARTTSPLMSPSKSPSRDLRKSRPNVPATEEVVKCSEPVAKEEINVETKEISQRFKFFENYHEEPKERKRFQMTPPREEDDNREEASPEPERDPNIVRCNGTHVDIPVTDTARKMLDKFKALQEAAERPETPAGPKPLKRITPPRDMGAAQQRSRSPTPPRYPDVVRCTDQLKAELPEADTARILREKFERWQDEQPADAHQEEEELLPQTDTAKNLRAKFEAIKEEGLQAKDKPIPRVKRFV